MRIAGARRKAGAHACAQDLGAGVGLQFQGALQHIDELVLAQMRVPVRRLSARLDPRQVYPKIVEPGVIAEPAVPALLVVGAESLRVRRRVALRQRERIEARWLVAPVHAKPYTALAFS